MAQAKRKLYTRQTMTRELAKGLVREHGGITAAARAIVTRSKGSENAVRHWISEALNGAPTSQKQIYERDREDRANQIANLLEEAGIPLDSVERFKTPKLKSGFHEVVTKDKDGNPQITRARSKSVTITLEPIWKAPEWPVVQPAKPSIVKYAAQKRGRSTTKTIVVLSDLQIGFLRDIENLNNLVAIHDERAIGVALQIVADLQPDQIGYVGDFLDLNEMSRWLQVEEFWRTTQPAIDEGFKILCQFEAAAGPREERGPTQFVAGNHDRRLREYIQKNARAAFHLRPANETPRTWPELTVPRLLRFDELGIEYVGEYPGGEWWITDNLVVRHNPESRNAYAGSVIAGHTHRIKRETLSRRTPQGPETSTLHEIGCLCRLDKYSDRTSLLATSVPSNRGFVKDWAHGFAVVSVAQDGSSSVEQVDYINPGRAIFRGKEYTA